MTLYEDLQGANDVALACAAALERTLGEGELITVGTARTSVAELVGDADARLSVVDATLADGTAISIALITFGDFAAKLERAAPDELLLTTTAPVLAETASAIAAAAHTDADAGPAREGELQAFTGDEQTVAFPLLESTELVGVLAIAFAAEDDEPASAPERPASSAPQHPAATSAVGNHGAQLVLADVEMGITAELGRSTLTIRELLSIGPGTVIDLDRVATAPVDILVNGTVIARGEVVVIDEEFGVRILEIIGR